MLGVIPSGTFLPIPPKHSGEPATAIYLASGDNFAEATKPSSFTRHFDAEQILEQGNSGGTL